MFSESTTIGLTPNERSETERRSNMCPLNASEGNAAAAVRVLCEINEKYTV